MDLDFMCNYCWTPSSKSGSSKAYRLPCNHLFCGKCGQEFVSMRQFNCPFCSELFHGKDYMTFQVVGSSIHESELIELKGMLVAVACANGMKGLNMFVGELQQMHVVQNQVRVELQASRAKEAEIALKNAENALVKEREEMDREFAKMKLVNDKLQSRLEKALDKNEVLETRIKDQKRQLENWKNSYEKGGSTTGSQSWRRNQVETPTTFSRLRPEKFNNKNDRDLYSSGSGRQSIILNNNRTLHTSGSSSSFQFLNNNTKQFRIRKVL